MRAAPTGAAFFYAKNLRHENVTASTKVHFDVKKVYKKLGF